jgi:hypothetical protein
MDMVMVDDWDREHIIPAVGGRGHGYHMSQIDTPFPMLISNRLLPIRFYLMDFLQ